MNGLGRCLGSTREKPNKVLFLYARRGRQKVRMNYTGPKKHQPLVVNGSLSKDHLFVFPTGLEVELEL